ncbi:MAG: hypothetical protein PHE51_02675 [Eubacteriales bacterium]|nr:hypothetical protein [Eubacteriales bacterium]
MMKMKDYTWNETLMEIEKANNLAELFALWKHAHTVEDNYEETTTADMEKESFITDGYIFEDTYSRVLFVLKEVNQRGKSGAKDPSERTHITWYQDFIKVGENINQSKQHEKMGRMACYVLDKNESPLEEEIKNGLRRSAFMNLNKRGGSNKAEKVDPYARKYAEFIKKQISLLNPDVIVCLGTFEQVKALVDTKDKRVIDMWHPAYRMSGLKRDPQCKTDKNVDLYMREFIKRFEKH